MCRSQARKQYLHRKLIISYTNTLKIILITGCTVQAPKRLQYASLKWNIMLSWNISSCGTIWVSGVSSWLQECMLPDVTKLFRHRDVAQIIAIYKVYTNIDTDIRNKHFKKDCLRLLSNAVKLKKSDLVIQTNLKFRWDRMLNNLGSIFNFTQT